MGIINLNKGDKINLYRYCSRDCRVLISLEWDIVKRNNTTNNKVKLIKRFIDKLKFECDAWILMMKDSVYNSESELVYYNQKEFYSKKELVVLHHGDKGKNNAQITLDLSKIPDKYNTIILGITIYQGKWRRQSFKDIKNIVVSIIDEKSKYEICKFNQSYITDSNCEITFIAGKFYKENEEWNFKTIGKGTSARSIGEAIVSYKHE